MPVPFYPFRVLVSVLMLTLITLTGCLPGSDDGIDKYNQINQRAAIANTGISLGQAADNALAHEKAAYLRRKVILEKVPLSFIPSVTANNPMPSVPDGVTVRQCGRHEVYDERDPDKDTKDPDIYVKNGKPKVYAMIAYFNKQPKGVPDLKLVGERMAAALSEHYGAEHVGLYTSNSVRYPLLMTDPNRGFMCDDNMGSDIVTGSPIVVVGFRYNEGMLPGQGKTLDTSITRDITLPCPSPLVGVIKRKQECKLQSDLPTLEPEKIKVMIGKTSVENDARRANKEWECKPDLSQPLPAPTSAEMALYCRDPSQNLTKAPDNAIDATAYDWKKTLESNNGTTGYYTYKCQDDGTGHCKAEPYTGDGTSCTGADCKNVCDALGKCHGECVGPDCVVSCTDPKLCPPPACTDPNGCPPPEVCPIELSCVDANIPPLYVKNPKVPLETNAALDLVGENTERECGRGWTGDMYARYLVRRCDLYATDCHGTKTYKDTKQTVYYIAYAGAQCHTHVAYSEVCPIGSGWLPVERDLIMKKPVALDWSPLVAGTASWSVSNIATNDSRAEVKNEASGKFVVPNISQADLNSVATDDVQWSLVLAKGMASRDPNSIEMPLTACHDVGKPCGEPSKILFLGYDTSTGNPLRNVGGFDMQYDNLKCRDAGGSVIPGTCHPLLGFDQKATCSGTCEATRGDVITITPRAPGGDYLGFEELLKQYNDKVLQHNVPPGYAIEFRGINARNISGHVFDDPSAVCDLGRAVGSQIIAIGTSTNARINDTFTCNSTNKDYSSINDLFRDVLTLSASQGKNISVYSNNTSVAPGTKYTDSSVLAVGGSLSTTVRNFLTSGTQPYKPCDLIH